MPPPSVSPATPGVGDDPGRHGQAEGLRLAVELAEQHAGLRRARSAPPGPRGCPSSGPGRSRCRRRRPTGRGSCARRRGPRSGARSPARTSRPRSRRPRRRSGRSAPGGGRSTRSRPCAARRRWIAGLNQLPAEARPRAAGRSRRRGLRRRRSCPSSDRTPVARARGESRQAAARSGGAHGPGRRRRPRAAPARRRACRPPAGRARRRARQQRPAAGDAHRARGASRPGRGRSTGTGPAAGRGASAPAAGPGETRQPGPEQVQRRARPVAAGQPDVRDAPAEVGVQLLARPGAREPSGSAERGDVVLGDRPALGLVGVQQLRRRPSRAAPRRASSRGRSRRAIAVFMPVPPRGVTRCAASPTRNARPRAEAVRELRGEA